MKKLAILLAILISFGATLPQISVKAEDLSGTYARIVTNDCAFFSDASLKIVKFYLPETYAVKIVSVGAECSRVVYMDGSFLYPMAEGYVKNICLSFLDEEPAVIYPSVSLTVISDEVIFGDTGLSQPKAVIPAGSNASYYGNIKLGGNDYEYVYVNGYIGYMRKDCFAPFTVPLNELPVEPPIEDFDSSTGSPKPENPQGNFSTSEILVIAVIVIAGLSLMFFVLKPTKEKPKTGFNDDD